MSSWNRVPREIAVGVDERILRCRPTDRPTTLFKLLCPDAPHPLPCGLPPTGSWPSENGTGFRQRRSP
eukprot:scaffold74866_cov29-Tisochrysis_lutea.AAC.2